MSDNIKEYLSYIIIIVVVVLVRFFIITPVRVDGNSMSPTLDNGNIVFLNKLNRDFKRFDIVVFDYNDNELVKRIIGLPGDDIKYQNGKLFVNDNYVSEPFDHGETADYDIPEIVPKNKYFVMGDNRTNSLDSRYIGFISTKDIKGSISFSLIPFKTVK